MGPLGIYELLLIVFILIPVFVLIPLAIYRYGKKAGRLEERERMNRVNDLK